MREVNGGRSVRKLWLQPNIYPQGYHWLKNKLICLNGYPKLFPMVVHTPKVSWLPPWSGLVSEFPSPRTPRHNRQCFLLSGCYARLVGPWLLIGYSQLTYRHTYTTHTYINTFIHIYTYTIAHTQIHIYFPSCYPTCRCATPLLRVTCSDLKIMEP